MFYPINSLNFNFIIHSNYFLVTPVRLTAFSLLNFFQFLDLFSILDGWFCFNNYEHYSLFIDKYIMGKLNNAITNKIIDESQ